MLDPTLPIMQLSIVFHYTFLARKYHHISTLHSPIEIMSVEHLKSQNQFKITLTTSSWLFSLTPFRAIEDNIQLFSQAEK